MPPFSRLSYYCTLRFAQQVRSSILQTCSTCWESETPQLANRSNSYYWTVFSISLFWADTDVAHSIFLQKGIIWPRSKVNDFKEAFDCQAIRTLSQCMGQGLLVAEFPDPCKALSKELEVSANDRTPNRKSSLLSSSSLCWKEFSDCHCDLLACSVKPRSFVFF